MKCCALLVFSASLALNAVLLCGLPEKPSEKNVVAAPESKPVPHSLERAQVVAPEMVITSERPPLNTWESIRKGDLKNLVTQLRSAGWPISVIRAVVRTQVEESLASRNYNHLLGDKSAVPWWGNVGSPVLDQNLAAASRAFYQEETRMMQDLLGPDAVGEEGRPPFLREKKFGNISPAKTIQVAEVDSDYSDLRTQILQSAKSGKLSADDQAKLVYIDQQMRQDLARILTPSELEDHEIRSNATGNRLRAGLGTFHPSEQEFRALFRVSQSIEEQLSISSSFVTDAQLKEFNAALNGRAETILGRDRYAEFVKATGSLHASNSASSGNQSGSSSK